MEMFQSCRRGDLEQVIYLTEHKEVELNIRDIWDSTPLYYACLCGHLELVKYLLTKGAICDSNTFDGERCVYGALTDSIRKLLLDHKMLTPMTMRREAYTEFLRRLLQDEKSKDITFCIHGELISAHKCILSTRSAVLRQMFEGRWRNKREVNIHHRLVSAQAFKQMLEWLYTGQVKVDVKDVSDFAKLIKHCKLTQLQTELDQAFKKADSFVLSKRGAEISTLYLDSKLSQEELQQDFGVLAQQAFPVELRAWNGMELPGMPKVEQQFVDVVFVVDGFKFFCHKPVFFARSEYFRALLADHFDECENDEEYQIPTVCVQRVSPQVFGCIVSFVYTNYCDLSEEVVAELLHTADMFLLPGLKKLCGKLLAKLVDMDNVLEILTTARLFNLARLEDLCTGFIARNIEQLWTEPELLRIVEQDAVEVVHREETDSIPIIDDIRSHIRASVKTMSDMEEAEARMAVVDTLLAELGLAA
eukprot:GFUD01067064.1.p1 GENE.GFUD01067064.1~~GFUD01067064.1.p1  ORF type:complete len:501 (+),score=170.32 GFUD01067064.1:80-1504(+)